MPLKIINEPFSQRVEEAMHKPKEIFASHRAEDRMSSARNQAIAPIENWQQWREEAAQIRDQVLNNLPHYLAQLEKKVKERGGKVFFAKDADEANDYIVKIAAKKRVVKSKSMVTEEMRLTQALGKAGADVLETDMAEYILQLADHDPPFHLVVPSIHKTKEDVKELFEKEGYRGEAHIIDLIRFARGKMRERFFQADIGITGCNFAIAETGSICIVTNEGNGRLVSTLPKTLITVMGMEKILPKLEDLDLFLGMLCRSAIGQHLTSYISVFTSPPNFHLVILDGGRSKILGTEFQSILRCIRCAACINVCPIYRNIGGHAYGSIYPGPIGAVLSPLLDGYKDFKELPFASSLCAACTEVCPVAIPLHELLIRHREKIVQKEGSFFEKMAMRGLNWIAHHPRLFHLAQKWAPKISPYLAKNLLRKWTQIRDLPHE